MSVITDQTERKSNISLELIQSLRLDHIESQFFTLDLTLPQFQARFEAMLYRLFQIHFHRLDLYFGKNHDILVQVHP